MKFLLPLQLLFLISILKLNASVGEIFGPSALSAGLGNQFVPNTSDSANNYHLPALLAFDGKSHSSINISRIQSTFSDINSVVTENSLTANLDSTGNIETDYEAQSILAAHLALPAGKSNKSVFGFSIFTPLSPGIESQTGDPFRPEYVMYRGRFTQSQLFFNYARKFNEQHSWSVGVYTGIQVASRIESRIALSPLSTSSGSLQAKAEASLAGRLSYAYKWNQKNISGLNINQEMKSNLEVSNLGETADPNLIYNLDIKSLLHYSPWEFKLTHMLTTGRWNFLGTVEYQVWSNYESPLIRIRNLGGNVQPSSDLERLNLRNIFIGRLGTKYDLSEKWNLMFGLAYRQSPLQGDFSGAGNSVDANSFMASLGASYRFSQSLSLTGSIQSHELISKNVRKTDGLEDGTAGSKIGSPGYEIGGRTTSIALGLQFYL